jgi:hypothetical protein
MQPKTDLKHKKRHIQETVITPNPLPSFSLDHQASPKISLGLCTIPSLNAAILPFSIFFTALRSLLPTKCGVTGVIGVNGI